MYCGGCKANVGATGKVLDEGKFKRCGSWCTTDYKGGTLRWR